jgi:hypothetical protein
MPPDFLLWLVVIVILGPSFLTVLFYVFAGIVVGGLHFIEWVTG